MRLLDNLFKPKIHDLKSKLNHSNRATRIDAIEALGRYGGTEISMVLMDALRDRQWNFVEFALIFRTLALAGEFGDTTTSQKLIAALRDWVCDEHSLKAFITENFTENECIHVLQLSKSEEFKAAAVLLLERLGGEHAERILVQYRQGRHPASIIWRKEEK